MSAQAESPRELAKVEDVDVKSGDLTVTTKHQLPRYAVQRGLSSGNAPSAQSVYIADTVTVTNHFHF